MNRRPNRDFHPTRRRFRSGILRHVSGRAPGAGVVGCVATGGLGDIFGDPAARPQAGRVDADRHSRLPFRAVRREVVECPELRMPPAFSSPFNENVVFDNDSMAPASRFPLTMAELAVSISIRRWPIGACCSVASTGFWRNTAICCGRIFRGRGLSGRQVRRTPRRLLVGRNAALRAEGRSDRAADSHPFCPYVRRRRFRPLR